MQFCFIDSLKRYAHRRPNASRAKAACAAKSAGTSHTLFQLLNNDNLGHGDLELLAVWSNIHGGRGIYLLDNQLCDAVADLDLEVDIGQVSEDDADRTAVVCVNDTRHGINAVLGCEPGAGSNTSVCGGVSDVARKWLDPQRKTTYMYRRGLRC